MSQVVTLPKVIASIITLALILIFSLPVLAQDATSETKRKDRLEERKQRIEDRIEAKKERVEDRIEERKARIATREAALKARLDTFKDKKKAQTAERINTTLANINEKITAAMSRHLEKMTRLLGKLKDPAAAREAIAAAKDKIAAAQAAVEAQAEKDYVIVATSEATIRADAQAAKEQLHTDLKTVRQLVIEAKQAVANAIRKAKSNEGGKTSDGQ